MEHLYLVEIVNGPHAGRQYETNSPSRVTLKICEDDGTRMMCAQYEYAGLMWGGQVQRYRLCGLQWSELSVRH